MPEDSTRKLLKIFGVAVTDFEDESARLAARAEELAAQGASAKEWVGILKDALELTADVVSKWLEVTQLIMQRQRMLHERLAAAASKLG